MINRLQETSQSVAVQDTTFAVDVMGRYICNTWDEAVNNGVVAFDAVVIGAGMFGAYCAEKIYRHANLRVLVLDAGSFLVSEHVQNLSKIGLNPGGATVVGSNTQDPGVRELVWGSPWRSPVAFPGLAYCLGGRSLYWGGWSPRLTPADLAQWPGDLVTFFNDAPAGGDAYRQTEREIGVDPATDYISGPLYDELHKKMDAVIKAPGGVPSVDSVNDHDKGAPLAVQAAPPAAGLFSFDKYSSAPILTEAIREAAGNPDWRRRLFLVPHAHVVKLHTSGGVMTQIEVYVNGQQKFLPVGSNCAVVLASSTIESTRLALESFATPRMGRNLMGHLRSNTVVRIKRAAFGPLPKDLQAAALLVRGSTPQRRYHLQVTAAAVTGADSESTMFRMVPDIELLDKMMASQNADSIVITFRGIGEMVGNKDPNAAKNTGNPPNFIDLSDQTDEFNMRRAWVNLVKTQQDDDLWKAMDEGALALALKMAGSANNIEYFYNKNGPLNAPASDFGWHKDPPPLSLSNDRNNPNNKVRDGLGTTHHEAGTLWIGADTNDSVTNADGRFHHIANAYVAGPGLFPTLGSANPSLTAITLARRTAVAIVKKSLPVEPGFRTLGSGGLDGWQMAGFGGFMELGANIIETIDGIGLLWYTREQFDNFILRLDWRASFPDDNSGVFIRFPALGNTDPANDWKPPVDQGYEIQIDDTGKNPDVTPNVFNDPLHRTGAVYKLAPANNLASLPLGQWNTYQIEANGNDIKVTLNGQLVSHLQNGNRSLKGFIGLQNHHFGSKVQFKNIRIKPL
jgi:choline dehydrogenase-like flavoprotein